MLIYFMADFILREATFDDSKKLKILEQECPQGTNLKILSDRDDFFYRSKLYGNHYTLVAVESERIIGVLAAVKKQVNINGRQALGIFLYDLRVHPDYRRTFGGRIMLRAWRMVENWSVEQKADFTYGYVKSDNLIMRGFFNRKGYTSAGNMAVTGRPVFKIKKTNYLLEKIDCNDKTLSQDYNKEYGSKNLMPSVLQKTYLSPEMENTGIYDCYRISNGNSYASAGLVRISELVRTKVIKIPLYYILAGVVSRLLNKIIPLPIIPKTNGLLKYYHCINHFMYGPEGMVLWKELMKHFNNIAYNNGNTLLTSSFDKNDLFYKEFSRGSISSINYIIGYKKINQKMPDKLSPFYPDPRDMD
jgi:ribosomal protein S18 acetylase RimI-like enzyme